MYQNNETAATEALKQPNDKVAIYMLSDTDAYDLHTLTKHESYADAIMFKMEHPDAKIYDHIDGMILRVYHYKPIQFVQEWLKSLNYKRASHTTSNGYKASKIIFSTWDHKDAFGYEYYFSQGDAIHIYHSEEYHCGTDFFAETKNLDLAVLMCKELDGQMSHYRESRIPCLD